MELRCNGVTIPIGQMGPGFFISHQSVELTSDTGTIHISIDGNESSWLVRLPDGLRPGKRTPFLQLSEEQVENRQPAAA